MTEPAAELEASASAFVNRPRTFESLRVPQYRLLFSAGLMVFLAVQGQQIARGQIAYELTGSNAGLGGVYLGFGIPLLLLTPFGGVMADRLRKRLVMVCAQSLLVVSALWIGIAESFGVLEYWMLIGASLLQGAGFSVFGPTRVAFTAELVDKRLFGNAVAMTQLSMNSTRVFAPALAGILIGISVIGTDGVYLITATILIAAVILTSLLPAGRPRADRPKQSVAAELAEGLNYVRSRRSLFMLVVTSFVMIMASMPYVVFLPAVAQGVFDEGPTGYGMMGSVTAVAAIAVTFWIARSRQSQAWAVQSVCGVVLGLGLLLLAVAPTFYIALIALMAVGGAASGYQTMNNTLALTETDAEYHGRVQSLLLLGFSGFMLVALPIGAVADSVGLRPTFATMGLICIATMAVYVTAQRRHASRDSVASAA